MDLGRIPLGCGNIRRSEAEVKTVANPQDRAKGAPPPSAGSCNADGRVTIRLTGKCHPVNSRGYRKVPFWIRVSLPNTSHKSNDLAFLGS